MTQATSADAGPADVGVPPAVQNEKRNILDLFRQ